MSRHSDPKPRVLPWLGDLPGACHPHFLEPEKKAAWPDEVEGRWEVVVAGAGLSGLTAAYHLRDREVLVLDAGDRPGGVCQSGSYQGVDYPAGSAYFYYPGDDSWQSWYRDLGLPLEEALISAPVSALFFENRWYPDCFSQAGLRRLPLPPEALAGLERLAEELAAWEDRWDPLGSPALPHPGLDRLSLAQYLEGVKELPPQVTRLFTPYCRSCLGAGPEAISAWAGVFFLMAEFSPGTRAGAFPGGNARIAQALRQRLPHPPRLRQTLVAVQPTPEAVQLLLWDNRGRRPYRLEAGVVILAMGKFAVRRVLPGDCGWSLKDFARFRYSSYLVTALAGRVSLAAPGFENWVVGEELLSDFVLSPREPEAGRPRVMTVFSPQVFPQGRGPLMAARAEDKARELLGALERLFPGTAGEVAEMRLYRFGHAQIVPYPGFLTFLKGNFPPQQGRIMLANSDSEGLPCIEAAIVQGQQAARRARTSLEK